jgi:hypothetical protein
MTHKILRLFAVFIVIAAGGCDIGQFTQSQEFDDYVISVTHDPHPVLVAQPEKVYVTLRKNRSGISGCRVAFRKSRIHGSDEVNESVDMPEGGQSGIYHVKNITFPESGDWEMIFDINCAGREREIRFPVVVSQA